MKIGKKLLVVDVDGTLLNSQREISVRTQAALVKAQQAGCRLVLASGRPPYGLAPFVKQLDLDVYGGYVIAYNGSQIIDAKTGEVMYERWVNAQIVPYLEKKTRKNNFAIFTYGNDGKIITDSPENPHIKEEARINGMKIVEEPEFSTAIDFSPSKLVAVSDDEAALEELDLLWKRRLNGTVEVHRSEDYFLEILPYGVDKSAALSVLLDFLHVALEDVTVFGDGVRDVGMLQMAGCGIAMANARESVRACADFITASNDEDGVAQVVEKALISEMQQQKVPIDELNRQSASTLMGNLGISYTFASAGRVEATMPVDRRTRQPFGVLHGGASLALAETVAGLGSMILANPDESVVGMQVSGNHISSAHEGDSVRAVATIVHAGRSSHVWNVDVFTSSGKLVSSVRVVNSVMKKR